MSTHPLKLARKLESESNFSVINKIRATIQKQQKQMESTPQKTRFDFEDCFIWEKKKNGTKEKKETKKMQKYLQQ